MNKAVLSCFLLILLPILFYSGLNVTADFHDNSYYSQPSVTNFNTIWVPDNYTTIQAAIYAADNGDTVKVRAGTYYENLRVNQSVKLIGEGSPTIYGLSIGMFGAPTVDINSNNVTVCGFIIQHQPPVLNLEERDFGIRLSRQSNITGNIIRYNREGIATYSDSHFNIINNNTIEKNGLGLRSDGAWNNITNNIVINNGGGMDIHNPGDMLINNTIANNTANGVELSAWNMKLRNNNITGSDRSFIVWETLLSQLVNDIDTSNTINGKPIYYWINQSDKTVPSDAGYVAIINSTNITVEGLNLENNGQGVLIAYSSNVTVEDCNLTNNWWGVRSLSSSNISLYHNNIIDNFYQYETNRANLWDDGYPSGGNYWSDHVGVDSNRDGIGDTPHVLDGSNQDNYPLMGVFSRFNASVGKHVNVISNSTLKSFAYFEPNSTIRLRVSNMTTNQTYGFCRIRISYALMSPPFNVTVDDANPIYWNYTLHDDGENRWIYFAYEHSTLEIVIIPEFPPLIILPLFIIATLLTTIIHKTKHPKQPHTTPRFKNTNISDFYQPI